MNHLDVQGVLSGQLQILSDESGPAYEFLDRSLDDALCLLSDGRLLIDVGHMNEPGVYRFIETVRARELVPDVRLVPSDRSQIATIRQAHTLSQARSDNRMANSISAVNSPSTSSVQQSVYKMLVDALDKRASDIHIRVGETCQVLYRINGEIQQIQTPEKSRIEAMCRCLYATMCDVSEADFRPNETQDAKMSRSFLPSRLFGVRVATAPQVGGFLMVLRLLYASGNTTPSPEKIGFQPEQLAILEELTEAPAGITVIAGGTGSGKSTTLQCLLANALTLSDGKLSALTVEDPPEYPIPGAVQIPVSNASNEEERRAAFARAIKAMLRLDPDICMIGEVRDGASGSLAIQAAMTGHQVWTTIHANSATGVLARFADLGVDRHLFADPEIVRGLVFQTLIQTLCPHCSRPFDPTGQDAAIGDAPAGLVPFLAGLVARHEGDIRLRGDGCERCKGKGITGRALLAEVVRTDATMMRLFLESDKIGLARHVHARPNYLSLADVAIRKLLQGSIDPRDAVRSVGRFFETPEARERWLDAAPRA
ncbi:GspE/PulE family protein [Paludibacterium paludis]|nr:ATPase, T2SS/T4P/T4SS family [Paludibacterium paludis]